METKFTPGPWTRSAVVDREPVAFIYGLAPDGTNRPRIAKVEFGLRCGNDELAETDANAHLIASSPALYEALEKAIGPLNDHFNDVEREGYPALAAEILAVCDLAEAALAKARGEQL